MTKRLLNWLSPGVFIILIFQVILLFISIFNLNNVEDVFLIFKLLMVLSMIIIYSIFIKNKDEIEDSKYIEKLLNVFRVISFLYLSGILLTLFYSIFYDRPYPRYEKQNINEVDNYENIKFYFEEYNKELNKILPSLNEEQIQIDNETFSKLTKIQLELEKNLKRFRSDKIAQEINQKDNYLGFKKYFRIKMFLMQNKANLTSSDLDEYYEQLKFLMSIKNLSLLNGLVLSKNLDSYIEFLKTIKVENIGKLKIRTEIQKIQGIHKSMIKENLNNDFFKANEMLDMIFGKNILIFIPLINVNIMNDIKYRQYLNFINYYSENDEKKIGEIKLIDRIISPVGVFLMEFVNRDLRKDFAPFLKTRELIKELH